MPGKASPDNFKTFVKENLPDLCADLERAYASRPGAATLYDGFRNGFAHSRGPKPEFAIAEDDELDGDWADRFEVDGLGSGVALNVDRLARETIFFGEKQQNFSVITKSNLPRLCVFSAR